MQLFNFVASQIERRIERVSEGEISALPLYIEMKRISKLIDEEIKKIQPEALEESHGVKSCEGVEVSVRAVGGRWDFSPVPEWIKMKSEIENLENKYKALQKSNSFGSLPVDEETGEILPLPIPPKSTDAIFLKFPK